ncbi:glycosyltransferase family 4 protein [Bathymodiolus japonicus methanotrophic gill symbiont]|uniref:glycosyltransferase family 4 protein n=1 Tax=Bathymodiolus japonicus methanotrophic gill symbiont TaxID=113269 RepID=UPI001C8D6FB3|nr:MraY family glycosyltransferase [Bathymodiolus japonicus methanotrophic gill symbiont]
MSLELDYQLFSLSATIIIISYVLSKILIIVSPKLSLLASPNKRTMHMQATANSGGIAIFFAFILGDLFFGRFLNTAEIVTLFLTLCLGIYDDRQDIRSTHKLLILIGIVLILVLNGLSIQSLGSFAGYNLALPFIVAEVILVFSFVGFINAMNLIDGLDGLAASIGIIIISAFAYMGYKYNDSFLFFTSLSYVCALLGFFILNWKPAKIFMGDSGSLVLGLFIAIISVHSIQHDYISPISVLLLAAVPILDTLIVLIRRISRGKNPFVADRTHIHHIIFGQQRKNVKITVLILALIQLLFTSIELGFKVRDDLVSLIVFILMLAIFYLLLTPKRYK